MRNSEKTELIQEHLKELNILLDRCRGNVNMEFSQSQRDLFQAKSIALLALTNLNDKND